MNNRPKDSSPHKGINQIAEGQQPKLTSQYRVNYELENDSDWLVPIAKRIFSNVISISVDIYYDNIGRKKFAELPDHPFTYNDIGKECFDFYPETPSLVRSAIIQIMTDIMLLRSQYLSEAKIKRTILDHAELLKHKIDDILLRTTFKTEEK